MENLRKKKGKYALVLCVFILLKKTGFDRRQGILMVYQTYREKRHNRKIVSEDDFLLVVRILQSFSPCFMCLPLIGVFYFV
jgi:hypothetical protein